MDVLIKAAGACGAVWVALCLAAVQPSLAQRTNQPIQAWPGDGEAPKEQSIDDIRKSLNEALDGVRSARISLEQATENGGVAASNIGDKAVQMMQQIKAALLQVKGQLLQDTAPEIYQAQRDVDAALEALGGPAGLRRQGIFALINVERTTARVENRIDRISSQARAGRLAS